MLLSPRIGRVLSAVGAVLLIIGLFMVWYNIARSPVEGSTTSTGWQTFPRLRIAILAGALITLGTAFVPQTRVVLVIRTLFGLVLAALIIRRIIAPPDIDATVTKDAGVYVSLAGALAVALGGLVDSTRKVVEVMPGLGAGGGGGARALPSGDRGDRVSVPNLAGRDPGGAGEARPLPDETARR
jgi:hypothetical protein